ncbi:MAG: Crp/Fnr family transcriptional regulator [bacterium]|nr:Crp/Fnr family transcriptional regulator [bacterium]
MTDIPVVHKLDNFFANHKPVYLKKGEVLLEPCDSIKDIFYLKSGSVKMSTYSQNGEEVILHVFRPPSYFPTMLSLGGITNRYYFQALQDVEAIQAPACSVVDFLKENLDVLLDLNIRFSKALNGLMVRIENGTFQKAYSKTISLFLYLSDKFGHSHEEGTIISLQLTHQDIAAWLGLRRETVSRQIEQLQQAGLLLNKEHHFIVPDIEKLRNALQETNNN